MCTASDMLTKHSFVLKNIVLLFVRQRLHSEEKSFLHIHTALVIVRTIFLIPGLAILIYGSFLLLLRMFSCKVILNNKCRWWILGF